MSVHPLAGQPVPSSQLADIPRLVTAFFLERPDPAEPSQRVAFGTSGHRGSALTRSFNETHVLAITHAICRYRAERRVDGPLFLGADTHALSEPAKASALRVLAANNVDVMLDKDDGPTPTPAVSHAILTYNRGRRDHLADGIVITPSHNPPEDGGLKYNPPSGGPANTSTTKWIETEANRLIASQMDGVWPMAYARALDAGTTHRYDYLGAYVGDLASVVDMETIRSAGLRLAVDPLGGAGVRYWSRIAEQYGIDLAIVNPGLDPTFRLMRLDWDGRIRMDCSSPHAMAGLIELKDRYDVAWAADTDHDRHGIVTPAGGLMNPNHYLAAAIDFLFRNRPSWKSEAAVGKTVVSSSIIDRVAARLGRKLVEVPVGFKWFVDGLLDGSFGFGGEESAGASFLRRDGTVWTTEKDGIIMGLLAAEMRAKTGRDPAETYSALTADLGSPAYERIDMPAGEAARSALGGIAAENVRISELGGEKVAAVLTTAPGNGQAIGGIKVLTKNAWFAARPSGTENLLKLYTESFLGPDHLRRVQEDARAALEAMLGTS
ncbi:MAG: phosphoglucomutase (alpha-D-glucose-1,6-bisphosphate-dependent) [Vicinamibacterales bacterium]